MRRASRLNGQYSFNSRGSRIRTCGPPASNLGIKLENQRRFWLLRATFWDSKIKDLARERQTMSPRDNLTEASKCSTHSQSFSPFHFALRLDPMAAKNTPPRVEVGSERERAGAQVASGRNQSSFFAVLSTGHPPFCRARTGSSQRRTRRSMSTPDPEKLEHVAVAMLLGIKSARVIQAFLGS